MSAYAAAGRYGATSPKLAHDTHASEGGPGVPKGEVPMVPSVPGVPSSHAAILPMPTRVPKTRWVVAGSVLAAAAALLMVVWLQPEVWQRIRGGEPVDPLMAKLVEAVGEERYIEARLTGGFKHGPLRSVMRGPEDLSLQNISLLAAAGDLQQKARAAPTPDNLHAFGVSQVLLGHYDSGLSLLEDAVATGTPAARMLSDLSAAYLARAAASQRADDWPRSLANAERAIRADDLQLEAWFNRAMALDRLHLTREAAAAWQDYLDRDATSEWARDAQRALARLRSQGAADAEWPQDLSSADIAAADLERFAETNSQRLREAFEDTIAPAWARAAVSSDAAAAGRWQQRGAAIAAAVLKASGDRALTDATEAMAADPAQTDWNRGLALWKRGRQEFQEDRMAAMTATFREAHRALPDRTPMALWSMQWVATGLYYAGDLPAARELIQRTATAIDGRPYLALQGRLAWLSGTLAFQEANFELAAIAYRRAAELLTEAREVENAAAVTQLLAEAQARLGDYRASWANTRLATERLPLMRDPRRRYSLLAGAGASAMNMALPEVADHLYAEALRHAIAFGAPGALVGAYQNRARARFELGDVAGAMAAISAAEREAVRISDPGIAARFIADLLATSAAVQVSSNPAAAAGLAETALQKYQSIASQYRLAGLHRVRGAALLAAGNAAAAERVLIEGVNYLEDKRALLSQRTLRVSYSDSVWDLYQDLMRVQAIDLERPLDALYTAERSRGRALLESFTAGVLADPVRPEELAAVLPPHQAVLFLAALDDRSLCWVIRADGTALKTVPLSRSALMRASGRYRAAIAQGRDDDANRWSRQLHQALFEISAVGDALHGITDLITIADGAWQTVPLAALRSAPTGEYLVERFTLSSAPSATVLVRQKTRPARNANRKPVVSIFGVSLAQPEGLALLPAVDRELSAIRAAYHQASGGDRSTPAAFLRALQDSDVVHFAGHAVPDELQPWNSRLVFERGPDNPEHVRSLDVEATKARAALVVLAACRTAEGPPSRGEGLLALARSFLTAGVPTVVAALGDVVDEDTALLMTGFHQSYAESGRAASSLRRAQLQAIASGRPIRSWATFIVVGE